MQIADITNTIKTCARLPQYRAVVIFKNYRERNNFFSEWLSSGYEMYPEITGWEKRALCGSMAIYFSNGSRIELYDAIDTQSHIVCGHLNEIIVTGGANVDESVWALVTPYRITTTDCDVCSHPPDQPQHDADDELDAHDDSLDSFLAEFRRRTLP